MTIIVLPRVRITREYVLDMYKMSCEELAKKVPLVRFVVIIGLLSEGPKYPIDIQWVLFDKMGLGDAYPALTVLECLGLIEPVGRPIDITKPHGTTLVKLTVDPKEALDKVKAVIGA